MFTSYKLKQLLKRSGKTYLFEKELKDKYGNPLDETQTITVIGVFIDSSSEFLSQDVVEASSLRERNRPTILTDSENFSEELVESCRVTINNTPYRVLNVKNLGELNQAYKIFVEVIV